MKIGWQRVSEAGPAEAPLRSWWRRSTAAGAGCDSRRTPAQAWGRRAGPARYWSTCCRRCGRSCGSGAAGGREGYGTRGAAGSAPLQLTKPQSVNALKTPPPEACVVLKGVLLDLVSLHFCSCKVHGGLEGVSSGMSKEGTFSLVLLDLTTLVSWQSMIRLPGYVPCNCCIPWW